MVMLIFGIILDFCFLFTLFVALFKTDPGREYTLFGAVLIYLIPGVLLTFFGARSRKRFKLITMHALSMLKDSGHIDCQELCGKLMVNELTIRKNILKAQSKGFIPFRAEIR